jgi:hypothetical protein
VVAHHSEIAAIDPCTARLAFDEVLGLVHRWQGDRFADVFAARDVWRDKSPHFRSNRPVNRALGVCHGLRSGRSLAPHYHIRYGYGPFPHLPLNALNDRIFDVSVTVTFPRDAVAAVMGKTTGITQ